MPTIPVLTDTLRWVVSGRNIRLVAGETTILRGAFTGRREAVRIDWRGCFTNLAAASRALGLTAAPTPTEPS